MLSGVFLTLEFSFPSEYPSATAPTSSYSIQYFIKNVCLLFIMNFFTDKIWLKYVITNHIDVI